MPIASIPGDFFVGRAEELQRSKNSGSFLRKDSGKPPTVSILSSAASGATEPATSFTSKGWRRCRKKCPAGDSEPCRKARTIQAFSPEKSREA